MLRRLIIMWNWRASSPFSSRNRFRFTRILRALASVAFCDPIEVSSFRGKQLARLQALALASAQAGQAWNSRIPPEISPAAGKLKITAFASLMKQANLGGEEWLKQFVYGFPLVGSLSQQHAYPFYKRAIKASLLAQNQLLTDSGARFSERAKNPVGRTALPFGRKPCNSAATVG